MKLVLLACCGTLLLALASVIGLLGLSDVQIPWAVETRTEYSTDISAHAPAEQMPSRYEMCFPETGATVLVPEDIAATYEEIGWCYGACPCQQPAPDPEAVRKCIAGWSLVCDHNGKPACENRPGAGANVSAELECYERVLSVPSAPRSLRTWNKVTVCHIPTGNPKKPETIKVSKSAVPTHIDHGDCIGSCPCSDCVVTPDPFWVPCNDKDEDDRTDCLGPRCFLPPSAPCNTTVVNNCSACPFNSSMCPPPPSAANCSALNCAFCSTTPGCVFCANDTYGSSGVCKFAANSTGSCTRTISSASNVQQCFTQPPVNCTALDCASCAVAPECDFCASSSSGDEGACLFLGDDLTECEALYKGFEGVALCLAPPPPPATNCTALDCTACALDDACVFCASSLYGQSGTCLFAENDTSECVRLVEDGADVGLCFEVPPPAANCSVYSDCASCKADAECQWCVSEFDADGCVPNSLAGLCPVAFDAGDECPTKRLSPVLECTKPFDAMQRIAYWGYNNQYVAPISHPPPASNNKFTPSPDDRGQPSTYGVGRVFYAFSTVFPENTTLVWSLGFPGEGIQSTATASNNPANACPVCGLIPNCTSCAGTPGCVWHWAADSCVDADENGVPFHPHAPLEIVFDNPAECLPPIPDVNCTAQCGCSGPTNCSADCPAPPVDCGTECPPPPVDCSGLGCAECGLQPECFFCASGAFGDAGVCLNVTFLGTGQPCECTRELVQDVGACYEAEPVPTNCSAECPPGPIDCESECPPPPVDCSALDCAACGLQQECSFCAFGEYGSDGICVNATIFGTNASANCVREFVGDVGECYVTEPTPTNCTQDCPVPPTDCASLDCAACALALECGYCFSEDYGSAGTCFNLLEPPNCPCVRTTESDPGECYYIPPVVCNETNTTCGSLSSLNETFCETLLPVVHCVRNNGSDVLVYWGYYSGSPDVLNVPVGGENMFESPSPSFVGQPTVFDAGYQSSVFTTTLLPNETQTWLLGYPGRGVQGIAVANDFTPLCFDCSLIDDCGDCSDTVGCVWCDGQCVEAAGGAPLDTSIVCNSTQCTCPPPTCAEVETCGVCSLTDGCTWCNSTDSCVSSEEACADPVQNVAQCGDIVIELDEEDVEELRDSICCTDTPTGWVSALVLIGLVGGLLLLLLLFLAIAALLYTTNVRNKLD
ncbi:MAG: hypothetical protein AB7P49_04125 [Bdellovibrionales bacterium]